MALQGSCSRDLRASRELAKLVRIMASYDPNTEFEPGKLQMGIAIFTALAFTVVAIIVFDVIPTA